MPQINLHVTPEFERALDALVRGRHLPSKSEAIRHAVQEAAAPYLAVPKPDYSLLEGLLKRKPGDQKRRRPMSEFEHEIDVEMDRALRVPKVPSPRKGKGKGKARR